MDSGNSGSIQSTSTGGCGDDQEFESSHGRETMTTLFNSTSMTFNKDFSSFDPPSFTQSFPCNNVMINDIDHNHNYSHNNSDCNIVWPNKYICSGLDKQQMSTCATQTYQQGSSPPLPIPTSMAPPMSGSPRLVNRQGSGGSGRNPKKRSRVSRRVPTTVLTTDTSNFRQMVQEFTGIPSPPFPSRARFDFLGGLGKQLPESNGGVCNFGIQTSPSYVMRSFPHKILPSETVTGHCDPISSLGVNATHFLRNEFVLGHNMCSNANASATIVVGTTTTTTTTIGTRGNVVSVEDVERNYNGARANVDTVDNGAPLINHEGIRSGEAILDSWICSSD